MGVLVDARTVELTRHFYEWEIRGRGWTRYADAVALEPAFQPFPARTPLEAPRLDDARRDTWLSRLVAGFTGGQREPETEVAAETAPEPQPPADEGRNLQELLIALPEDTRVSRTALLGWLGSLSAALGPVAFELLGGNRRVEVRLAVAMEDTEHVVGQLKAAVPAAVVTEAPQQLEEHWLAFSGPAFSAVEFGLACEFMVPLASARTVDEPLLPLIAALADVEEGELGLFQVLLEDTRAPWETSVLRSVVTPGGRPFFADAPEITALAKDKVSSPLFAVCVRIAGAAADVDRAFEIVRRVAAGLRQFGSPQTNELIPLFSENLEALELDLLDRTTHRSGMLLSAEELVSLVQLPGSGVKVPELYRAQERTKQPPEEVLRDGCAIGTNEHQHNTAEVRLPVDVRTKHVHVLGASGTGKSTLLLRMILEDIDAGHGVGLLDPHGDLVDEVAARVPEHRISDVVFFDPSDENAVIGWNILGARDEVEKELLSSDLVGVFRRLSTSWGDQMTAVLGNAILVFLESSRGGTLEDLRRFLVDATFRKEMLATVRDPYARSFWETEFPLLVGRRPQAPILIRLDTFLRSRMVRRVVTVRQPKLDFRAATDSGLIFLGKLASGAIGEENAALLGSLLVSKFHQVSIARADQTAEARRPFFLYVDEFHHVATPSMASLFSGARKYRLGLTVAHQNLYQLHASVPEVERSLLANAYTRICFQLGEEDARGMAKGLSFFTGEDLMGLGVGEAICRVGGRTGDFNLRTQRHEALDAREAREREDAIRTLSAHRWGVRAGAGTHATTPNDAPVAPSDTAPPPLREREREPEPPLEGQTAVKATPESPAPPQLDKTSLDYLTHIAADPFLSVRERNRVLGLSAWKGQRIKSELLDAKVAQEVSINPGGRGQQFKLLELTAGGRELLARYGVTPASGHGRGGVAHQWWVTTIAAWIEEQRVTAKIEDDSRGARVDVAFAVGRQSTAIEVEMGEGHAIENVRKDLDAGFNRVVCLLDESEVVERIQAKLSNEFGEELQAEVGDLRDFEAVLAPHLHPHPPPLRPQNQNREQSARRRRSRRTLRAKPSTARAESLLEPGVFSTPVAAEYLGLSPATLETLRSRGGGPPFVKLGRRVVYRREDLDEWIAERRRRSTSDSPPSNDR